MLQFRKENNFSIIQFTIEIMFRFIIISGLFFIILAIIYGSLVTIEGIKEVYRYTPGINPASSCLE